MIKINIYNSRKKVIELFDHDIFTPINIFTCGLSINEELSLEKLKLFFWSDFIIFYLQEIGFITNIKFCIKDIENKINLSENNYLSLINKNKISIETILEDLRIFGCKNFNKNNLYKSSDNIEIVCDLIDILLKKNFAYKINDGSIYFDTSKIKKLPFPETKLNNYDFSSSKNISNKNIRSTNDFLLWKNNCKETYFDSIHGKGVPGKHIVCSAICETFLDKVHIHIGSIDHIFPHHTFEIIQTETVKNIIFDDYWIHIGSLNFNGNKLNKSQNLLLLKNINYKLLRMYFFTKSYRSMFDYDEKEIELIKKDFIRLHLFYNKLKFKFYKINDKNINLKYSQMDLNVYDQIINVISWDFDTCSAINLLINFVNKYMDVCLNDKIACLIIKQLNKINNLLNIFDYKLFNISEEHLQLINEKEELKKNYNFFESTEIKKILKEKYYYIEDYTGFTLLGSSL